MMGKRVNWRPPASSCLDDSPPNGLSALYGLDANYVIGPTRQLIAPPHSPPPTNDQLAIRAGHGAAGYGGTPGRDVKAKTGGSTAQAHLGLDGRWSHLCAATRAEDNGRVDHLETVFIIVCRRSRLAR